MLTQYSRTTEELLPTTIDSIAGYDLTELEMKTVETKREEVKRKQTLREARISKAPKVEPAATATTTTTSASEETVKETPVEGSNVAEPAATVSTADAESKPAEAAKPKEWKHVNISCNLCSVSPIVGPRFHCTEYVFLSFCDQPNPVR
jgi:hypothetical protein